MQTDQAFNYLVSYFWQKKNPRWDPMCEVSWKAHAHKHTHTRQKDHYQASCQSDSLISVYQMQCETSSRSGRSPLHRDSLAWLTAAHLTGQSSRQLGKQALTGGQIQERTMRSDRYHVCIQRRRRLINHEWVSESVSQSVSALYK